MGCCQAAAGHAITEAPAGKPQARVLGAATSPLSGTGLAKCGVCGSSYVKISANLFGCAAARDRGTCVNRLNIRTETLENTILDLLKTRLMEPQLFKAFCEEFHREVNRLRIDESSTLEAQRTGLEKVKRRTGKLIELITEDDAPVQAMKAELRALEAKQIELEKTLASAQAPAPLIRTHPVSTAATGRW